MIKTKEEQAAYNRMAAYCSRSEHCSRDIMEKLSKWELDNDAKQRIVDLLQKEKFIDDDRYAASFIRDRYKFAKWGMNKIRMALQHKDIPAAIISHHLQDIDRQEYLSILSALLKAKRKTIKGSSDYECKAKLIRFAVGRGFDFRDICQCMNVPDELDM